MRLTGQISISSLPPNTTWEDLYKEPDSESFIKTQEMIEEKVRYFHRSVEKSILTITYIQIGAIVDGQDSLTVQYFAPNNPENASAEVVAHFVVTSPFQSHNGPYFEDKLKNNLDNINDT